MPKSKAIMLVSDESYIAHRTRSKFTKKNECVVVDIRKPAETISRLPCDVASDLALSVDSLRDVTIQNLRSELTNMSTRAEKKVCRWLQVWLYKVVNFLKIKSHPVRRNSFL
ncbi:hypothetical protein Hanom_Chr01g00060791 [Helianthus anomalus]